MGILIQVVVLAGCIAASRAYIPADASRYSDYDEPNSSNETESIRQGVIHPAATDQHGRPVPSETASLTVGPGGVILLQDVNLINSLAHFDRERIPERVVHAKGGGAHGVFTVTHDITNFSKASLFAGIGKETKVFVRFSSVIGEAGSADTLRSPRGFAVKFYTDKGNWDLVGNNLQVFPIKDPILFPHFIHSQKRNPSTHLPDQNAIWDFFSLRPESTHFVVQLYSDVGLPDGWRFMNGGGVHTYKLINSQGIPVYCKFHWVSNQGVKNIPAIEAAMLGGADPDYYIRDLYDAIAQKEFPSWKLYIQVMTFDEAENYKFNPFDVTKTWSIEEFPLFPVGQLVLNRNPVDYFSEVESSAFCPGNMVPGIEQSPDPLLIGRSFSYSDTQRHRIGTNFAQLPINHPKYKVNTYQRDGPMAYENGGGVVNYMPNSYKGPKISKSAAESVFAVRGDVVRNDTTDAQDNFVQAREFLITLKKDERERLILNLASDLRQASEPVRTRTLKNFNMVETQFSAEVERTIAEMMRDGKSRRFGFKCKFY